ncbi:D-glycerate dehydrogenase [Amaricoccus sp.]|uniref:2-hydroxyacid dehydrogenase n=1 Tax=Amaricoccus sp. TaxID=1872485 RepID=UPI00263A39F3|nr:D-glycerate dehydrogenase [Amaricoccus sp.]HRO10536.1 D-glycerate dehydrogenase [Amaricoccus sp.]
MAPKPRVVVTRRLPEAVEARLAAAFDATLNPEDRPLPREELTRAMREADGVLVAVNDAVNAELLATPGRRVRIVSNFGVGVNNIDLAAAKAAGVAVGNTPGVLTDATADIALALILAATRRMSETEAILRAGGWDGFRPTGWLGMGLQGKTLGILGMGRIGAATARRAALGFGMRIAYFNRSPTGPFDFPAEALPTVEAVLAAADVVSLHVPGGGANRGLLSAGRIAGMKRGAYLVNTARGDIVDEAALAAALARGHLAGAGLDVYAEEPKVPEALLRLPNVTLLPHIGSATLETRTAMGMLAVDNLAAFFAGEEMPSRVA